MGTVLRGSNRPIQADHRHPAADKGTTWPLSTWVRESLQEILTPAHKRFYYLPGQITLRDDLHQLCPGSPHVNTS